MLSSVLSGFYERDIQNLIAELNKFRDEKNIWLTAGSVKNSAGNLALHIAGGLNHFFGATLAQTGYKRNRDLEFSAKNILREELVTSLGAVIPVVKNVFEQLGEQGMAAEYPFEFDGMKRSNTYVLTQLSLHLNYHLGQVNYLRRVIDEAKL